MTLKIFIRTFSLVLMTVVSLVGFGISADTVTADSPTKYVLVPNLNTLQNQNQNDQNLAREGKLDPTAILRDNVHGANVTTEGLQGQTGVTDQGPETFSAKPSLTQPSTTYAIPTYVGSFDQGIIGGIHWYQVYFVVTSGYTCFSQSFDAAGNYESIFLAFPYPGRLSSMQSNYAGQAPGSPIECQVNVGAPAGSGSRSLRFDYDQWVNCSNGHCTGGVSGDPTNPGTVNLTF
jgi:hypothetical protein